jgi:hypothetical protein
MVYFLNESSLKRVHLFKCQLILGKFVYASLVVTFRHGREEDEMMGVSFKKELVVDRYQIYPAGSDEGPTKLQV